MTKKGTGAILLESMFEASVEILGRPDSEQIFSSIANWPGSGDIPEIENSPKLLSEIGNEFAVRHHRNTAKGLMVRLGESVFSNLRRSQAKLMKLGTIENRLKPISERFDTSLEVLARSLSILTSLKINSRQKSKNHYCIEITHSGPAKLFSSDLHLFFFSGILRSFCIWLDSRKDYSIDVQEEDQISKSIGTVCLKFDEVNI
jgi:hypothetical protein